jgi:hypothetical protein
VRALFAAVFQERLRRPVMISHGQLQPGRAERLVRKRFRSTTRLSTSRRRETRQRSASEGLGRRSRRGFAIVNDISACMPAAESGTTVLVMMPASRHHPPDGAELFGGV